MAGAQIEIIPENQAEGKLKELYTKLGGQAANIIGVHSLSPDSMESHLQFYRTIMFGKSPLSRKQRETIATVVSAANECHY